MTWKHGLQRHVYRLQRIAMPASLALLVANLSLSLYGYIAWRGVHPYVGLSGIFLALSVLVVLAANAWVRGLGMHIAERRSLIEHNPVEVYAFTPFQVVDRIEGQCRVMDAQASILLALGEDGPAQEIQDTADRWRRWAKQGYIPRDEYPEWLRHYYRDGGGAL